MGNCIARQPNGSKPKFAYARNKDFKKIIKYLLNQTK